MPTVRNLSPVLSCTLLLAALLPGQPFLRAQQPVATDATPTAQQDAQQETEAGAAADHAQKVQDLLAKAQASYKSGLDNYNANRLDAARLDFDHAVDLMLSSGLDLKNDPDLSDEFDQLLSQINALELVALKQGNGFSPKLEEVPVDSADEVTFAPNPLLVSKVTNELKTTTSDLPLVINEYVAGWIDAYTNKTGLHTSLKHSLERAGKYKTMIQRILNEYGVPQDLIYQAVTESGFQPQVLNRRSGAGGMWQFMPFAGAYGLERNGYFDERFDPEKSTIAYAKYMKFLYSQFGDWYLAMAAYDWGPGRVQHVVSKTGYADYWEIYNRGGLPAETKAYIPSVIAAIIMAKNPEQYGLADLVPDAPVVSDMVTTDYAIDLRLVADLTDSTVADVVALNPALLRLATPSDIPYDLHIPEGTKQEYMDRLQNIPEQNRSSWRFHVVKDGETLDGIAATYRSHAAEIASYNQLKPSQQIEAGEELVIPAAASPLEGQQRYTVRSNDTLVTVADRFGVTVEQLRSWNKLSSSHVAPGRSLYVAEPIRLAPMGRSARTRHGHSGSSTATTHNVHKGAGTRDSAVRKTHTSASTAAKKKKKQ